MDYGIALSAGADAWKVVRRAEELGFTHAWFYDTQLLCADVFVAMAAAAVQTRRIRLGTGVLIPSNRLAAVAANGLASLNKLAPGRIDLGIGTGFTARRTMGLGALRLSAMEDYIRVVRGLLAGETVEAEIENERRKIRFLNPEIGCIDIESPIELHISAFGPKGRDLTARIADGWMTFLISTDAGLAQIADLQESCRKAGRDPASVYTTAFGVGCVLRDGEEADSPRARTQAGPLVAVAFHSFVEAAEHGSVAPVPDALAPAVDAYRKIYETYEPPDARYLTLHRGHLMFTRPEEAPFLTAELIRGFTLTGTREEIRKEVERLETAGFRQLAIQLINGHEDAIEDWADAFGLG